MAEYIDRSKLEFDFRQCNRTDSNWTPQRVVQMIHRQPTADVAQVRHGKWIGKEGLYQGTCIVCGYRTFDKTADFARKYFNYCPNCGAKMDLEVSDGKA